MESHSTKIKSRAPSKKRALLRAGSLVVSAAIALSPGAVPAMTALRAMADKGELITLDTNTFYDSTDREGMYIENLFYNNVEDGTSGYALTDEEQLEAYSTLTAAVKDIADGKRNGTVIENVLTRDITAPSPDTPDSTASTTSTVPESTEPGESTSTDTSSDSSEASESTDTTSDSSSEPSEPSEPTGSDAPDSTDTADSTDVPTSSETVSVTKLTGNIDTPTDENDMRANIEAALACVVNDIPAYLYWFRDTHNVTFSYDEDNTHIMCSVELFVSDDYMEADNLHTDTDIMGRARAAAKLAETMINESAGLGAAEKAAKYCADIRNIPAPADDAAAFSDSPTIDPKRLVKVFSGESGLPSDRANAFQYLCNSGGVDCITVSGWKNGSPYIWNVISVGGENYLVDVNSYELPQTVESNSKNGFALNSDSYMYTDSTAALFGDKLILKTDNVPDSDTSGSSSGSTQTDPATSGSSTDDPTTSDTPHEHIWSTEWKSSADIHWRYCTVPDCSEISDAAAHIPGAAATATTPQTCTVCGYVITPATGHEHVWSEWKSDFNGHWRECLDPDCPEITEKIPHTRKTERIVKVEPTCQHGGTWEDVTWCTECHYVYTRTDVKDEVIPPAPHDWEILKTTENKPTCDTAGSITENKKCKVCQKEYEDKTIIPKLGHKFSTQYYCDENEHWYQCENCGEAKSKRGSHVKGNGVITTAPTETEPGVRTYSCTICKYVLQTEEIKPLGANHKHNYNVLRSDDNMHWFECSCGEVDLSSRTKHKGVEKEEIITEATCGETGLKEVITYCSEKKCNRELDRELKVIPKTDKHTFDKGVCKICGEKDENYVEPHTHNPSATWYSDAVNHWHLCTVANCKEQLNKGTHKSNEGSITYPPTATAAGLKTYSCTECGRTLRTEIIPATGSSTTTTTPVNPSDPSNPSNPSNPYNPGSLNISQSTQSGANAPRAQIRSANNTLFNALLTAYERERVQNGESMVVRLTIENADASAPDSDRAAVERVVSTLSNYKVGQYLDVNLYKTVGSDRKQILASINDLTITFDIPESIRGKSSYAIVRMHDGASSLLQDKDNDPNTITVDTSLFSTYAIIYRDQASNFNPDTGIADSPYIVSTIIGASVFIVCNVIISAVGRKKRRTKG